MQIKLFIVIVTILVSFFMLIFRLLHKKKIIYKYALAWLFLGVLILIFALCPSLLQGISNLIGIMNPVNMLFFFGFCFSLCIIFFLSMTVSHLSEKVKKLAQELAILKKGIYDDNITSNEK